MIVKKKLDSISTFVKSKTHPFRIWKINKKNEPQNFLGLSSGMDFTPRQYLPDAYELDGSIYAFKINKKFLSSKSLVFGKSYALKLFKKNFFDLTSTELDYKNDFEIAEIALTKTTEKKKKYYE